MIKFLASQSSSDPTTLWSWICIPQQICSWIQKVSIVNETWNAPSCTWPSRALCHSPFLELKEKLHQSLVTDKVDNNSNSQELLAISTAHKALILNILQIEYYSHLTCWDTTELGNVLVTGQCGSKAGCRYLLAAPVLHNHPTDSDWLKVYIRDLLLDGMYRVLSAPNMHEL